MASDSDLHQLEAQRADSAAEIQGAHRSDASPPRFGRFALCMAAAGALAFGVFGTVAYGVWFNHDQQAYAEAIASARQALGMPVAATLGASGAAPGMALKSVALTAPTGSAAGPQAPATNTLTTAATRSTPAATGAATSAASAFAPAMTATTSNAPLAIASAKIQTIASPHSTGQASSASGNGAGGEQGGREGGRDGDKQAVWSGPIVKTPVAQTPVAQTPVAASSPTMLADTASDTPSAPAAPSPRSSRRVSSSADSATQQSTVARPGKDVRNAQSERRTSSMNASTNANAKHKDGLFARVGQFFRRVNYPQHDSGRQQQDLYSHP
jgi:hypothetical protein